MHKNNFSPLLVLTQDFILGQVKEKTCFFRTRACELGFYFNPRTHTHEMTQICQDRSIHGFCIGLILELYEKYLKKVIFPSFSN